MTESKSEIAARIEELEWVKRELGEAPGSSWTDHVWQRIDCRLEELRETAEGATEDLFRSVIRSHEAICAVKQMEAKAAYGQDPASYYTLAVCGEAGEMANKIVKALRNGDDPHAARAAVITELPDVFIYGAVLAHVLEIDITKLVIDKVEVVIERARTGYYGPPLPQGLDRGSSETGGTQ